LYDVGSVRKALEILCAFNGGPPSLGVADVSRQLGMPKSTAHNLLQTLESLDFLRQDPADRRYRLGPRLYELGLQYSHSTHLISSAAPHLQSLGIETKETVKLGVRSGDEVLIVAAVESPYQLHTQGDLGTRAPLHCTGLGKAILATLGAEEVTANLAAENALRSTGPRTPEGKVRSSRNHLIHGLLAKGLIEGESREEFLAVYEDFHAEYDPQTRSEDALVERIALAYFRLARFTHVEAQFLQRENAEAQVPAWSVHVQPFDRVTNSFRNNVKPLHNLSLYEGRLERSFDRAVRLLRLLQAQRARQAEDDPAKPAVSETAAAAPEPETQAAKPAPAAAQPPPARKIGFEVSNRPQKLGFNPALVDEHRFSCAVFHPPSRIPTLPGAPVPAR
jgi:DNA-binding IclR family transcriptional regulator